MPFDKRMICGVIKQNQSEVDQIQFLIFLSNCMHHFNSYILQKTPLKLVNWFQRYEKLKDAKNNRKQETFVWLYLKINISDFRLILLDHITYGFSAYTVNLFIKAYHRITYKKD